MNCVAGYTRNQNLTGSVPRVEGNREKRSEYFRPVNGYPSRLRGRYLTHERKTKEHTSVAPVRSRGRPGKAPNTSRSTAFRKLSCASRRRWRTHTRARAREYHTRRRRPRHHGETTVGRRHVGSFVEIPVARRRRSCWPAARSNKSSLSESRRVGPRRDGMPYRRVVVVAVDTGPPPRRPHGEAARTRLATLCGPRRRRWHGYSAAARTYHQQQACAHGRRALARVRAHNNIIRSLPPPPPQPIRWARGRRTPPAHDSLQLFP